MRTRLQVQGFWSIASKPRSIVGLIQASPEPLNPKPWAKNSEYAKPYNSQTRLKNLTFRAAAFKALAGLRWDHRLSDALQLVQAAGDLGGFLCLE